MKEKILILNNDKPLIDNILEEYDFDSGTRFNEDYYYHKEHNILLSSVEASDYKVILSDITKDTLKLLNDLIEKEILVFAGDL